VDSLDAVLLGRNYLIAGRSAWDQGNFNYDSTIDLTDAQILQKNFSVSAAGSVVAATAASASSPAAPPVAGTDDGANAPEGAVLGKKHRRKKERFRNH